MTEKTTTTGLDETYVAGDEWTENDGPEHKIWLRHLSVAPTAVDQHLTDDSDDDYRFNQVKGGAAGTFEWSTTTDPSPVTSG